MGEHSVVYGGPCIVAAVRQKITVKLSRSTSEIIDLHLEDPYFDYQVPISALSEKHPKTSIFILKAIKLFYEKFNVSSGLKILTKAEYGMQFGLGSSSAVTVAVLKALSEVFSFSLSESEFWDLAYKSVLEVQGVASGFDVASAVFGGVIYYQKNKPVIKLQDNKIPLLVVYSGVKGNTVTFLDQVAGLKKNYPEKVDSIFSRITDSVLQGRRFYENSDWTGLGGLFNKNHKLLVELGVSTKMLDKLQQLSVNNGALGAKLSGAGGGDCLILLYNKTHKEKLKKILSAAGGEVLEVL